MTGQWGLDSLTSAEERPWRRPGESSRIPAPTRVRSTVWLQVTARLPLVRGTFHGSSATVDHDMIDATPNINPQPVAVVGEFNANFRDGTAAGGFGVNKK